MASPVPPGVPRQGHSPPNFNPNHQRAPDTLADNMQNLQFNRPTGPSSVMPGSSFSRPPPFAPPYASSAPSFTPTSAPPSVVPSPSFPGPSPASRPGPPPVGFPRVPTSPLGGPPQAAEPQNFASGRPSGPPFAQPSHVSAIPSPGPFASAPMASGPYGTPSTGTLANGPPQAAQSQNFASGRPSGPPVAHPSLVSARPSPGPFASAPMTSGPYGSPSTGPMANGPPMPMRGTSPSAPPFPVRLPPPGVGPGMPSGPTSHLFPGNPPSSTPLGQPSQIPPSFSTPAQVMPQSASPYGPTMGQMQSLQGTGPYPGAMQQPRMYGMPQTLSSQSMPGLPPGTGQLPMPGALGAGSKINSDQIPRPFPTSVTYSYETRQSGQANIPPPATSDYIVKDRGNCSPRYMRCTLNQIPCTGDILSTSSMQLALMVQPLALPHPEEEPIQVVDFGESGPVRCSRCKGYINPFIKFIDQGKRFICNLCGFADETPHEYHCNLGPDGRRRDADERPELCRGTVEFVATKEYCVRDPMPAVFFFLVDVSMNAIQTGATAAACSAISQAIADLPEGPRTMVGIATFDSTIHFYNLKRVLQQPLMLIVPDVQDVYTPLQTDVIVQLAECRQHLEQLLENIPTMFQSNKVAESAFGAALKAAFLAMKNTGGKLLVFQSVLPSIGFGALSARETEGRSNVSAGEKEAHKLLQPADKTLVSMALDLAEFQVCVDIFITTQTYVDIASISVVPKTTGGQVYCYYPFSAVSDAAKLYNDLRWNVTRPQGFEAVMRVRCSQGLQVQEYSGSFCKRIPTDVDLPAIDCDKSILVTFKHDDKFLEGSECAFQCALLYTTVYGERRIRVTTLSLSCTAVLSTLFRSADLDTQFACLLKQAATEVPTKPLNQVREQVIKQCIEILQSYRKYCATSSPSGQLLLPESLRLLPIYTLALVKSIGLRTEGRVDERSYWVSRVTSLPTPLTEPLVYPRMVAVHNILSMGREDCLIPPAVPLSSERVTEDGIFFLENGEDGLIYVGREVNPEIMRELFDASSIDEIPAQFVLQQYDNELSKKFNEVVNEIRRERCSYLGLRLCKKNDPSETMFFSYMVEDRSGHGHAPETRSDLQSYAEFLVYIHKQILNKMGRS